MRHDAYEPDDTSLPRKRAGRAGRGRHRRRPGPRRPSFRTTVATAGSLAAAMTVATGVYVMTLGSPADAGAAPAPPLSSAPQVSVVRPVVAWVSAPEAAAAGTAAQYVSQVVTLANRERQKAGCEPLRADPKLREAAQEHADDMAERGYYAHESPDGRNAGQRITAAHYDWDSWGENIHRGPHTPAQAVGDWMKSEGHRKNILNCAFKDIGVGVNLAGNGPWWVQDFATGR
ncbi:CAP domain-containing protein [Streptomyces sp. NPDC004788]